MNLPRIALAAAAVAIVATGCSKTVRVGAIISETGAAAPYGAEVKKGIELALAEINAAGGFRGKPLEIVYRDDATNPDVGLQVAEELIGREKIRIIIGAVSSTVTLKIAPYCEDQGAILLSPTSSAPEITQAGYYIFRNYPSDILEGTSMADFARDVGVERVVVISVKNHWGRGLRGVFAEKFPSKFRKVVGTYEFDEGKAGEIAAVLDEIKEKNPNGIYLVGFVEDAAEVLKLLRGVGIEALVLGTSSIQEDVVQLAGAAAENLVFPLPSFDPDREDPAVRSFVQAYRARFNKTPDTFSAHGYDALKLLLVAMEQNESVHPKNVMVGLLSIDNYRGASGRTAFDENGDVVQYPRLYIVRQGRPVPYDHLVESGEALQVPRS